MEQEAKIDREQVRRDAEDFVAHPVGWGADTGAQRIVRALLAELEQAERERDDEKADHGLTLGDLRVAERRQDALVEALRRLPQPLYNVNYAMVPDSVLELAQRALTVYEQSQGGKE